MSDYEFPPRKPVKPFKPDRNTYIGYGCLDKKTIYHDVEILYEGFSYQKDCQDHGETPYPEPAIPYHSLTLQDIVDLAPPNIKLSDITFNIDYPRNVEYIEVMFSHQKRDITKEEAAYQKDMKKYQEDYAKYEQGLMEYEVKLIDHRNWKKEQEIKELEAKLTALKDK